MSHFNKSEQDDWMTIYLKYLLFVFNFFFWVGGAAVMAVGIWTLVEKSDYLNILASSTFAVSAYILIFAGGLVVITGFLGFCAIIREQRSCLSALSEELKQHLTQTLTENYALPGKTHITHSVDRLQQDFKCCGSNSSADWQHSVYILSVESSGRVVPDSCCKTITFKCGKRDHPSNIYKVEGGCITKLEQFLADHLLIMGAVGIGVACLQLLGAGLTAYFNYILYKEEEEDAYSVM
ncbi:tetraspanin-11 isoform X3 [Gopherus flavomarginatus]|uniref:tetraspanin-11 isoform X3 n=1 Tax=Gopherus flavomarginatus TaxID=286002 RepID=UPI0021CC46E3|nr:tetraspanin-11 isoform X3 [Gopherus flavomarginatus]